MCGSHIKNLAPLHPIMLVLSLVKTGSVVVRKMEWKFEKFTTETRPKTTNDTNDRQRTVCYQKSSFKSPAKVSYKDISSERIENEDKTITLSSKSHGILTINKFHRQYLSSHFDIIIFSFLFISAFFILLYGVLNKMINNVVKNNILIHSI